MNVENLGNDEKPSPQTSRVIIEVSPQGKLSVGPEQLVSPCVCSLLPPVRVGTPQFLVLFDVHLISVISWNFFSFTRTEILSFP